MRLLPAIFVVALDTPWGIATLGEVNGSATLHFTSLNSSTYLLVLALVVTAVIAVVVLYFVTRRRQMALVAEGQRKTQARTC